MDENLPIPIQTTLRHGLRAGLKTTWMLSKIIFPITAIMVMLQQTPVLGWVIAAVSPFMGLFGLRGEAAIPLVLGSTLNLYAAIAGILSMQLTVKEVFIIAVMISFAHNMFVETGVAVKVGVKLWIVLLVRFGLAAFCAVLINLVWRGGTQVASYGLVSAAVPHAVGWFAISWLGLSRAMLGVFQLAIIVMPLMVLTQVLKDRLYLQKLSARMEPVMRLLGIRPNASMTLIAGFLMGLAYGAGVMIQAVKEDGVTQKDATLSFIFLMGCHAVVEDTLLFVPLGIPVWPLLLIRLVMAAGLTIFVGRMWSRAERMGSVISEVPTEG